MRRNRLCEATPKKKAKMINDIKCLHAKNFPFKNKIYIRTPHVRHGEEAFFSLFCRKFIHFLLENDLRQTNKQTRKSLFFLFLLILSIWKFVGQTIKFKNFVHVVRPTYFGQLNKNFQACNQKSYSNIFFFTDFVIH